MGTRMTALVAALLLFTLAGFAIRRRLAGVARAGAERHDPGDRPAADLVEDAERGVEGPPPGSGQLHARSSTANACSSPARRRRAPCAASCASTAPTANNSGGATRSSPATRPPTKPTPTAPPRPSPTASASSRGTARPASSPTPPRASRCGTATSAPSATSGATAPARSCTTTS